MFAVKETKCGKPSCRGVNHSFVKDNVLNLHFPEGVSSDDTFSISAFLEGWTHEHPEQGSR